MAIVLPSVIQAAVNAMHDFLLSCYSNQLWYTEQVGFNCFLTAVAACCWSTCLLSISNCIHINHPAEYEDEKVSFITLYLVAFVAPSLSVQISPNHCIRCVCDATLERR